MHFERFVGLFPIPRTAVVAPKPRHDDAECSQCRACAARDRCGMSRAQIIRGPRRSDGDARADPRKLNDARRRGIGNESATVCARVGFIVKGCRSDSDCTQAFLKWMARPFEEHTPAAAERVPLVERDLPGLLRRQGHNEERHGPPRVSRRAGERWDPESGWEEVPRLRE
jgi:hypothetical protein